MEEVIVLYPSPGMGHLVSMVELGKLILTHHPSFTITVLIITAPFNTGSTAPYIDQVSTTTPSIKFHHLPTITQPLNPSSSYHDLAYELPRLNNPNLHQALQSISNTSMLKALVIDFFCTAAFDITALLKIPTYYFITGCASGLAVFLHLPTIDQNTTKSIKDLNTNLNIPGLPPIPSSDMPLPFLDRTTTAYASFKNTAIQMTKSKGIIVNTVEFLEARAVKAITDGLCIPNAPIPPIFCIGPLIPTNHQTVRYENGRYRTYYSRELCERYRCY
ncbi:hypothetical protein L1049_020859 [Liquidambar formosana]|uniref:Uncharacterized protein n=1 Tax=Liquidambar formosana TaxID=63359 RepID=A0AAP0S873_LIQFO